MDEMAQVLAATAEEFVNAEVINRWMPPDGTYTVLLINFKQGVAGETNKFAWWRLLGTIIDDANPEVAGKDFTVGYYTSKAYGLVKEAASILADRKVTGNTEIAPVLTESVGKVVIVEVSTRKSKKDNVEYTNANILRVVLQASGGTAAGPTDAALAEGATA